MKMTNSECLRRHAGIISADAARNNLREAWAALAMIREAVEALAPIGSVRAAEHLDSPTFMHEADALVAGIRALAGRRKKLYSARDYPL